VRKHLSRSKYSRHRFLPARSQLNTFKFSVDEDETSRPSTPNVRGKLGSGSRPSTPVPGFARQFASHALHPKQPVQTPQQFYDWFAQIDRSVAHSQDAHFRAHVAMVSEHLNTADTLLERIDEVDREVGGLVEGWLSVEEGGKNLKDACERLLEERVRHQVRSLEYPSSNAPSLGQAT
jgi:conserved oligomeric Golgi complex subunit 3